MSCLHQRGIDSFRDAAWILAFVAILGLAACGGGGGGGGSAAPTPGSKLFVADSGNDAIASFVNSNPSPGTTVPVDRIIAGSSTNLQGSVVALALDAANDRLYVSKDNSVIVFNNASMASGNLVPNRQVATFITTATFTSLYLDTAGDILYVGDGSNGVRVYNSASTLNETPGPTTVPNRTISGDFGTNPFIRGVAVDVPNNILYVGAITPTAATVNVFDGQSGLTTGSHAPNRRITIPGTGMGGIFLDSGGNRLYVSDSGGNVFVFDGASTRNDPVTADRTILLGTPAAAKLAVDTVNNRLYAATSAALYIVPNASTGNGSVQGTVAGLAPAGGDLTGVAVKP